MKTGTLQELNVQSGDVHSISLLRTLLTCDPQTGDLFWKRRSYLFFNSDRAAKSWNTRFANKKALTAPDNKGYLHGNIFGRKFRAHTIVWAICTGSWPENFIDHINLNKSDNRIENLRDATGSQNQFNHRLRSDNTSGFKGVAWCKRDKKWKASIRVYGKNKSLGYYDNPEDAYKAYCNASRIHHGDFSRVE